MTKSINNLKELFSDEELAYFEAVAPTPDDYSGSRNGPSRRDLTDETNPNLSPKQKKIARLAGDKEKIDAEDLTTLRTGKKITEQSKYKVKKGDTLWDLAKQNNTTVDAIVKSSGIKNANKLSIGQEIVIPGKQETTPVTMPTRTAADSLQTGELIKRPVYMSTVDTGDRLVSVPADPLAQKSASTPFKPPVFDPANPPADTTPRPLAREKRPANVTGTPDLQTGASAKFGQADTTKKPPSPPVPKEPTNLSSLRNRYAGDKLQARINEPGFIDKLTDRYNSGVEPRDGDYGALKMTPDETRSLLARSLKVPFNKLFTPVTATPDKQTGVGGDYSQADRMPGADQPKTDLITRTVKTLDVKSDGTVISQPSSNKALPKPEPLATETPAVTTPVADKMNTNYWKQFSTGMFPGSGLDVGSRIIPGADVAQKSPKISNSELANVDAERADRIAYEAEKEKKALEKADKFVKKPNAYNLPIDNPLVGFDLGKYGRTRNESTMEENSQITEARGRPPKEDSLGANELHMNAKRAADNMMNITHKFANGERVKMTKGMGVAFLNRHTAARTSDDKDALLNYAHQSPETFENVSRGGTVPKAEKAGIKLGSMKAK
jgi:LysM repeat protein